MLLDGFGPIIMPDGTHFLPGAALHYANYDKGCIRIDIEGGKVHIPEQCRSEIVFYIFGAFFQIQSADYADYADNGKSTTPLFLAKM